MDTNLSLLSSLKEEFKPEDYVQPHYKESYRLAVDSLVSGGRDVYQELIKAEKIGDFLSEDEILFITQNAEQPAAGNHAEDNDTLPDDEPSTGTYWPTHSDIATPDLELGWPEVMVSTVQTNIKLLFHPPRQNNPTIKETVRKHIQDARQVIAIAMDVFTDVDIFKEVVDASVKGVPVYVLLDDIQIKSFLQMAENLDIQIQKLRNMRVRTVKGQDYLCRSGAKFNGKMEQKFLLVDCQTVIFGSYSFMWSYEKINLSMVQIITGQLVESFDEEFRTLYARSTIPVELMPLESGLDKKQNGMTDRYAPTSCKPFERKDQLRHTLDAVYRQACERQSGQRNTAGDHDDLLPDFERFNQTPLMAHNRVQNLLSSETTDFNKRHSYAGERGPEPAYIPHHAKFASSHWNVAGDSSHYGLSGSNHFVSNTENQYEAARRGQMYRGCNKRQSYHGQDKHVLAMQQNLPSLASTSKSYLRSWRLESYLNNNDPPVADSSDYLDQYEMLAPQVHSRLRSSLVFKSTIPEYPETNSYTGNSTSSLFRGDPSGIQTNPQFYPSAQSSQLGSMENRIQQDEFMLKRRSLQILDYTGQNMNYNSGRDAVYASLGRAKGRYPNKEIDMVQENWYKRHSVADPKSNMYYNNNRETSSQMYGSFIRRDTDKIAMKEDASVRYVPNLKEDQRSVSQYDFKSETTKGIDSRGMWQEPPSRTASATVLVVEEKEQIKSNGLPSPRFLKKSTKKIKSLLNIADKKGTSPKFRNRLSPKMGNSSDTVLSDDDEQTLCQDDTGPSSPAFSVKSTDTSRQRRLNGSPSANESLSAHLDSKASVPRFNIEHSSRPATDTSIKSQREQPVRSHMDRVEPAQDTWQRNRVAANSRLYSRFEPLCSYDSKSSFMGQTGPISTNSHLTDRLKGSSFVKHGSVNHHHGQIGYHTHGTNDNKFGRFIQRVGNFIHKNK